jgi:5-hydroxyisourate hydrolase
MSPITTHVLDVSKGKPAAGVPVILERKKSDATWENLSARLTDQDGRVKDLCDKALTAGIYRITFDSGAYFAALKIASFYPSVTVLFEITAPTEHHHVPLLLSPFGYSTYRGS